jgi:hypothetical protein
MQINLLLLFVESGPPLLFCRELHRYQLCTLNVPYLLEALLDKFNNRIFCLY